MSRLSLRSLLTAARSGLLFSLVICVISCASPILAQGDYAAMGGSMDPMTGARQQTSTIINQASGIKRAENSLGRLQALLYPDVAAVARINLTKIDYEGLSKFVDSFVDKAGGVVQSEDQYRVDLREYQKESAKSSFKKFLSTVQNAVVQNAFRKKFDEVYVISYGKGSESVCGILAFPTDGLSDADQNAVIDTFSESAITVFKRFGFVVAVMDHAGAVKADLDSIEAKYLAKGAEARKTDSAYGSYSVSGPNGGAGLSSPSTPLGSMGVGDLNNDQDARETEIPADLRSDYFNEVQAAKKAARTESRKAVLPLVRKRFSVPAPAESAGDVIEALRQTDGVAFAAVALGVDGFTGVAEQFDKQTKRDDVAKPFAGLGSSSDEEDAQSLTKPVVEALKEQKSLNSVKTIAVAISLVGSPKIAAIATFSQNEDAKDFADGITGALALVKPVVKDAIDEKLSAASDEQIDFTPFINDVFEAIKPSLQDNKVAVMLDLSIVEKNASLLLPLLGGKEFKSQQELESESIDWSIADEKATDGEISKDQDDNPFATSANDDEDGSMETDDDSDDNPFEDDDEDPF